MKNIHLVSLIVFVGALQAAVWMYILNSFTLAFVISVITGSLLGSACSFFVWE